MMKLYLFLFCISLFSSCNDHFRKETSKINTHDYHLNNDSVWRTQLHSYDTITRSGFTILYKIIDTNHFQISWGEKNKLQTYKDSFENNIADANIPRLEFESKNFLILRYGCGNPCWGCIALPKDFIAKAQDIMYPQGYNYEKDLIAYNNYQKKGLTIGVRNLNTMQEKEFLLCDTCFSAASMYCLDSVKLYSNKIYFKWNSTGNHSVKSREKFFKIDL